MTVTNVITPKPPTAPRPARATRKSVSIPSEIIYPDSDGKPMADNPRQFD
ncbi:MAG: hypothetical protein H6R23_2223, partial [Proteobacteria bacterium]|nr:hypothetical protein [Pseudomonadota bacterium]